MNKETAVRLVWNYMHLEHELKKADVIFLLGSTDPRTAEYAAQLFLDGWAPYLIISGDGRQHETKHRPLPGVFADQPEAKIFASIALKLGVPSDRIITELQANNTGENFTFTQRLLTERQMSVRSAVVVQKPYMERRSFATGRVAWPELEQIVTSPPLSYDEYVRGPIPEDHIINAMVGDLQRIKEYPAKGFQIEQDIPADVWDAYTYLVSLGYTKFLLKE